MGSYEALRGGGREVTGESIAKAQGHNGPSSSCTCESCKAQRERTNIYGPTPQPEPELEPTFTFSNGLNEDERADVSYLLRTGARRYSPNSFPLIHDFARKVTHGLTSEAAIGIDVSQHTKRDREHILKWLHEVHGKDTSTFGAENLLGLLHQFETFVYPNGYEPEVYPSVETVRAEYNASKQGMELR